MQSTAEGYPSKVNVTNCDREPIHIIGKSQAHGVILACHKESNIITQCSENSTVHFGIPAEDLLGKPLTVLLPEEHHKILPPGKGEKILLPEVKFQNKYFLIIAHISEDSLILDIEPVDYNLKAVLFQDQLTRILNELSAADSIENMSNRAVHLVKVLFGYDRVMLYQFDEEWNGEVIAEEREENLESWLGLHYPATDIPKPSRELFLKQGVRIISDVNYTPAQILPELSPVTNKPLDLSRSELRAVSPIHIQYLKNMKVGASLTAAIVVNGKLWGLFACHHYSPKFLDYHQRQSVKFLAQIFTNRLTVKTTENFLEKTQQSNRIKRLLVDYMNEEQNIFSAITERETVFTDLIHCTGGAILFKGEIRLFGKTPTEDEVKELAENLLFKETLFRTSNIEKQYPAASAYKDVASGVLSVKIGEDKGECLIWFREETSESVSWGGKPQKEERNIGGIKYLSPRSSFEKWTQELSGISRPWKDYEFDAAVALRETITHKIVQQQKEEINELNKRLTLVNQELEAFSYSISHDLRAPLRGISGYTRILLEDHSAQLDEKGKKAINTIRTSAADLNELINDLLSFARLGNEGLEIQHVNIHTLIEDIIDSLNVQESYPNSKIVVDEGIEDLVGDKRLLTQLYRNLIENALKYSAIVSSPLIEIGCITKSKEPSIFYVKDNGIGFDPKLSEKIFNVFSRIVGEEYTGTGIGLAIAKKVVAHHKGRIWVESLPGKGSTFYFTLAAGG